MHSIFKLDFSHIKGDFFGGLTAGIVALPLALAFGAQTELGAIAGLYGAIGLGVLAAFFGGTPVQISGPTAPMTVVSAAVIASCISESGVNSISEAIPLVMGTFFLSGVLQVVFGLLGLGKYLRFIPHPVVSGFMSGIGVIIIITQLFPLLGYNPKADVGFIDERLPYAKELMIENILRQEEGTEANKGVMNITDLATTLQRAMELDETAIREEAANQAKQIASGTVGTVTNIHRPFNSANGINWFNLLIGLGTVLLVYGFKRITTLIPSSLAALVIMSVVAYFFLPGQIPLIGEVQAGLPMLQLGLFASFANMGTLGMMLKFAVTLAALGAIDSLLTSVVADNVTKTKHNSNQELIGQGIGNMGAALIGGLPGAGATMRTVINVESGGKTKISGIIAGVFLLAVLLGVGPVVAYVPNAVLAGILLTVGIGIIDYKVLRDAKSLPIADVFVMVVVLLLTVFVDLLTAVAVGMVLAALLFMKSISDAVEHKSKYDSSSLAKFKLEKVWEDEADLITKYGDSVYIRRLEGPLFFGFASRFQELLAAMPNVCMVVIRMGRVPYVDQSGLYAMEEAIQDLQAKGVLVTFVGLNGQPLDMFKRINLVPGLVNEDLLFYNFTDFSKWLITVMKHERGLKAEVLQRLQRKAKVGIKLREI